MAANRQRRGRSGNPAYRDTPPPRTAGWRDWVEGARIRTLPMALAPVLIGTAAAVRAGDPGEFHWVRALLCLVIAVALQIGVNYANDYSDGVRGTDDARVGPGRLVGGGLAPASAVLRVALGFFGLAAIAGVVLTVVTGIWWLPLVGVLAIVAAWFYTGGRRPYGYLGFGEVFVFLFFGLVATLGTMYAQVGLLSQEAWIGAIGGGLIACAALEINNIRDIEQDRAAGKRTLSVRIGRTASLVLFCLQLLVPFALAALLAIFYPLAWGALFGLLIAIPACLIAVTATTPKELILVLKLVGFVQIVFSVLLSAALVL
ncbi:1,4-dihydroxy-2-naphthoate polyprenyltransferase [Mycetocola reblochoni]|uniref:1,4-dihydroxy-2-naphthoate octaprenyltransferase n=1 Tax=Mycetocola reblochoni TaxID=331618 RepID=A0A3L6ZVZ8_9MICO|nr:1,4-dihydroxy-2-naphthoate polyprenyltransferase [Mycetocola reblochoni]